MDKEIVSIEESDGYLTGKLLISTPQVSDVYFAKTVVFIAQHNNEGAMGFIINKAIKHANLKDISEELQLNYKKLEKDFEVYFGGPVSPQQGFIIHSDDYLLASSTLFKDSEIAVTADLQVVQDYSNNKGAKNLLLSLGYAGWSKGQIEYEVEANDWIVADTKKEILFEADNSIKWEMAAKSIGVDPLMLTNSVVGKA